MVFTLCKRDSSAKESIGGLACLENVDCRNCNAELGIVLDTQFWGTNLAKTGLILLIQVAFLTLHLRRVFARAAIENVRMHERLESLGFEREGVLRKDTEIHGEPHDIVLYAILKETYLHLK